MRLKLVMMALALAACGSGVPGEVETMMTEQRALTAEALNFDQKANASYADGMGFLADAIRKNDAAQVKLTATAMNDVRKAALADELDAHAGVLRSLREMAQAQREREVGVDPEQANAAIHKSADDLRFALNYIAKVELPGVDRAAFMDRLDQVIASSEAR
ncbi:MAG: hypothetical protein U9R73_00480 [Pseudomonadota bacterium]|nr:hypothetical protein [Pseudomonadota bacterium]